MSPEVVQNGIVSKWHCHFKILSMSKWHCHFIMWIQWLILCVVTIWSDQFCVSWPFGVNNLRWPYMAFELGSDVYPYPNILLSNKSHENPCWQNDIVSKQTRWIYSLTLFQVSSKVLTKTTHLCRFKLQIIYFYKLYKSVAWSGPKWHC